MSKRVSLTKFTLIVIPRGLESYITEFAYEEPDSNHGLSSSFDCDTIQPEMVARHRDYMFYESTGYGTMMRSDAFCGNEKETLAINDD